MEKLDLWIDRLDRVQSFLIKIIFWPNILFFTLVLSVMISDRDWGKVHIPLGGMAAIIFLRYVADK